MDRLAGTCIAIAIVALLLAAPQALEAQRMSTTIGAGVASPQGGLESGFDTGFTIRGQAGLFRAGSLQGHGQFGYTRFGGKGGNGSADVWNGGVGGRLWYRSVWAGANAFYLFGDIDNGFGFAPEVGARLGSFEVVADYLFGDTEWVSVRLGLRF